MSEGLVRPGLVDRGAVARNLSVQHHGATLPGDQGYVHAEFSDSDSEEEMEVSMRSGKTDAYTTRELCRETIGVPTWSGKSLTWKRFLKEWKAYWEIQRPIVGPKVKKWIFIRGLPEKWKTHMKAYITDANWTYKDIVQFLEKQCDIMVPDWRKEKQWRDCLPQGPSYMDFTHWWLTWKRLGDECDLRDQDWVHQFNACMNHKGYFAKYLKEILENEMGDGLNVRWNLDRRKTFVENKLMIAHKAQETLQEFSRGEKAQPKVSTCFNCGMQGHFASSCPKRRRSTSAPFPRRNASSWRYAKDGGGNMPVVRKDISRMEGDADIVKSVDMMSERQPRATDKTETHCLFIVTKFINDVSAAYA